MQLRFWLPSVVLHDGQVERPQIGRPGAWHLCFAEEPDESGADPLDEAIDTFALTAAPRSDRQPSTDSSGPFPTDVRGPGFTAFWAAPRRVDGPAVVRGYLYCDLLYGAPTPVTGQVTQIVLVTETMRRDANDRHDWTPVSAHTRNLQALPDRFDDGLILGEERYPGIYAAVRPDLWTSDTGVIIYLQSDNQGMPPES